jgi:GH24 family phage-related lysozyme (muramidase)
VGVVERWTAKLKIRRGLLDRARRSVVYWGRRAGSVHGLAMLREARARYALRKRQVAEAERVIVRHTSISTVSAAGVALVAGFEGFRSCPYRDAVGVWTIGFGETQGVGPGSKCISRETALGMLRRRLARDYLAPVLRTAQAADFPLTQNQADALASLVYNLGPGILSSGSTMGSAIRSRNKQRIADAFLVYDHAGGRVLAGLTRRRKAERALFLR